MRVVFHLVRHAEAEKAPNAGADRGLTAAGRAAFEALVRRLAPTLKLGRVVSSPYRRARETAGILAAAAGLPLEQDQALAAGGCGGPGILALGRAAGAGAALVGHNPEIAEAVAIAAGRPERVPPGAVAAVEAGPHGYRLVWIRTP